MITSSNTFADKMAAECNISLAFGSYSSVSDYT